jgi:hypothetical protein
MTNDELSRQVALACGLDPNRSCVCGRAELGVTAHRHYDDFPPYRCARCRCKAFTPDIPAFATSLDACFAPGGPVELLNARGIPFQIGSHHCLAHSVHGGGVYYSVDLSSAVTYRPRAEGKEIARTFCEAFLAAIAATQSPEAPSQP